MAEISRDEWLWHSRRECLTIDILWYRENDSPRKIYNKQLSKQMSFNYHENLYGTTKA